MNTCRRSLLPCSPAVEFYWEVRTKPIYLSHETGFALSLGLGPETPSELAGQGCPHLLLGFLLHQASTTLLVQVPGATVWDSDRCF